MTPLWGTPPRAGNPFWSAMDEGIGVKVRWQTQDGGSYGEKRAATLASGVRTPPGPAPDDRRPGGAHGTGQAGAVAFCRQFRLGTPRPISRC